ncbi:MAG: threonylcarbamoyl-AMP synthase [Thermoplasmata archaeon]|nr:threonylcarbamoyl-AMP synthase [Thermoplasmata archaeon]
MSAASTIEAAVRALDRGALVVYPTDTLLGLGALATHRDAVERVHHAKGRARSGPMSIAVSSYEEIEPWCDLTPLSRQVARDRLPGPVTLLLRSSARARRELSPRVIGPSGIIGIRIPDHPTARELARRAGPLIATSANRHGEPPARSVAEARRVFGREVAVYLPAHPSPRGRPSEILDLTHGTPQRTLRR